MDIHNRRWEFRLAKVLACLSLSSTLFLSTTQAVGQQPEEEPVVTETKLSSHLLQKRRTQTLLAEQDGVNLVFIDEPGISATAIKGIPQSLKEYQLADERQIPSLMSMLRPYYGLDGPEDYELFEVSVDEYTTAYMLEQTINGFSTSNVIKIWVDNRTRKLLRIEGHLRSGNELPTTHIYSQNQAIEAVRKTIKGLDKESTAFAFDPSKIDDTQKFVAKKMYRRYDDSRRLYVWWNVGVPIDSENKSEELYHWFTIDPSGNVSDTAFLRTSYANDRKVCDGSSQFPNIYWCGPGNPIVIDENGNCQSGYNCTATVPGYQQVYDLVGEVDDMLNDLVSGSSNVGATNNETPGDGHIDIAVDGNTLGRPGAWRMLPNSSDTKSRRSVILVDRDHTGNRKVIAHEMGHGLHTLRNYASYQRSFDSGGTFAQRRENRAVHEHIGLITGVIFNNYNGPTANPKFDTQPSWINDNGDNISQQFGVGNMSGDPEGQKYRNARVGGHAFYELVQASGISFERAAEVFLNGIARIADDDGDGYNDWAEVREGQIKYAIDANLGSAVLSAIRAAWDDVGVGPAGLGDNGGATPPGGGSGMPSPITGVSATLLNNCLDGATINSVSWTGGAGATYFELWYTLAGGTNYIRSFATNLNPVGTKNTADVDVKVRPCTAGQCNGLSSATLSLEYRCW